MTLTQPSFIILFPILAVFWLVYLLFEKEKRKIAFWGVGGVLSSIVILLGYCFHNQQLSGQFMLCNISYLNELSILIENELYRNDNYPEITAFIDEYLTDDNNSLTASHKMFNAYGYRDGVIYLKDTMKQKREEYIGAIFRQWAARADNYIVDIRDLTVYNPRRVTYMQQILMPFSFAMTLVICLLETAAGVRIWIKKKTVPYIRLGFPAIIISVMILSFGTLTHASPQRICIHMAPVVLLMVFCIIDRVLESEL